MSKLLLFIESNTTGTGMLALRKAVDWGYTPVFYTNNPDRYAGLDHTGCIVHCCDTNDVPALLTTIANTTDSHNVCGITTTSEFYLYHVATIAAHYGLPGNSIQAVEQARNKAATRRVLAAAGVRQPHYRIVDDSEQLLNAVQAIGLPCIVKPVDDSGSNDVRLCTSVHEVKAKVEQIWAVTTNMRGQQKSREILIEQYVQAAEYSVESLSWQGETNILGITQKSLAGLPFFVEAGHVFPAPLTKEQEQHIQQTVLQALQAIGFRSGAAHTEIKLTEEGCTIIEINGRLAGGMIPELIRLATGVDLLEQQIHCSLEGPTIQRISTTGSAAIRFIMAEHDGMLEKLDGVENAKQVQGIKSIQINTQPGKEVRVPQNAYDRLGYVIGYGQTVEAVQSSLEQALEQLTIVIQEKAHDKLHDHAF